MPLQSTNLPPELKSQLQLLIAANHILHHHGLVDAFGHISIRNPVNPSAYIISSYNPGAPALISSIADFIEYNVSDSEPVEKDAPRGYSERYIHGEIFKKYEEVNCVVHSHSEAVIPFTAAETPVRPVFHMAGFLSSYGPPTFYAEKVYEQLKEEGTPYVPDMLIKSAFLGSQLADMFSVVRGSDVLDWRNRGLEQGKRCSNAVVLQHKHGFTCVGDSIQNAVYRAIYTQKNCALLRDALRISQEVCYLTEEEAKGCARMNEMTADKACRLWLREVEVNPLYRNEEGVPKNLPVGGMRD